MNIEKLLLFILINGFVSFSQIKAQGNHHSTSSSVFDQKGMHFVIMGTFNQIRNASKLSNQLLAYRLNPRVEFNNSIGLFYVYVLATDDKELALRETLRIRAMTPYSGTWIYHGPKPDPEPEYSKEVVEVVSQQVDTVINESMPSFKDEFALLKPGQSIKLKHLRFLPDSDIFAEEARFEAYELLAVMKNNPNYKIKIHGHTNGNDSGIIRKRDHDNPEFFNQKPARSSQGSAKLLSELRAKTLKDFLILNGVNSKRMNIKGWGGKKPLFERNDTQNTLKNLRVEIQVVAN